jgi:hypothetical protein
MDRVAVGTVTLGLFGLYCVFLVIFFLMENCVNMNKKECFFYTEMCKNIECEENCPYKEDDAMSNFLAKEDPAYINYMVRRQTCIRFDSYLCTDRWCPTCNIYRQ